MYELTVSQYRIRTGVSLSTLSQDFRWQVAEPQSGLCGCTFGSWITCFVVSDCETHLLVPTMGKKSSKKVGPAGHANAKPSASTASQAKPEDAEAKPALPGTPDAPSYAEVAAADPGTLHADEGSEPPQPVNGLSDHAAERHSSNTTAEQSRLVEVGFGRCALSSPWRCQRHLANDQPNPGHRIKRTASRA